MTEFGITPLYTSQELKKVGVSLILYPRGSERVMSKAAMGVIDDILLNGTQQNSVKNMQTRNDAQKVLKYEATVGK